MAGEENVKKISFLVKNTLEQAKNSENPEGLEKLIKVAQSLLELMPKPLIPCSFIGCGRKFATNELLQDHWNRRHA